MKKSIVKSIAAKNPEVGRAANKATADMKRIYIKSYERKCAIDDKHLEIISFAYAHGELDHKVGYDIIYEAKDNHFDKRRNYDGAPCVAVLPSGEEVAAKFFYWRTAHIHKHKWFNGYVFRQVTMMPRGLLVASDDTDAIEYAHKCFVERHDNL